MTALLAINWEWELRGLLIVIIAVVTLCGSVYLILGTNLGARLGFLVTLTGLAGWMALMGLIWWIYGIGLKGPEPSWDAVPGRTVLQNTDALYRAGVFDSRVDVPEGSTFPEEAALVAERFTEDEWTTLDPSSPAFGQAAASAGEFLEETGAFAAGDYQVLSVFDTGGERYPKINESLDFLAFFHTPHYVVVEVGALEQLRTEPGRAPTTRQVDDERQRQYVYMIRNLGARRQPAAVTTIGSGIVFLTLCWLLHRREETVRRNRSTAVVPAG
jgi:hypothetical protein